MSEHSQVPEQPEAIKWIRWLFHYLAKENKVIRHAPLSFIVAIGLSATIIGYVEFQVIESHFLSMIDELKTNNTVLNGTINSLQATIMAGHPVRADSAQEQQGTSRVYVTSLVEHFSEDPIRVDVNMKNSGNTPAVGLRYMFGGGIVDTKLTDKQLDDYFRVLKANMKDIESRRIDTEFEQNEVSNVSHIFESVPLQVYTDYIVNGNYILYFLLLMEYVDNSTPKGKWRVTEVCRFSVKNEPFHRCDQHNRIFLSD
jgi:hypothetical protein